MMPAMVRPHTHTHSFSLSLSYTDTIYVGCNILSDMETDARLDSYLEVGDDTEVQEIKFIFQNHHKFGKVNLVLLLY